MKRFFLLAALAVAAFAGGGACGSGRTTFARYPGAPAAFDRTGSEAKAVEIADKVFAAAGGPANWDKAKQIKWHQTVTSDGKVTLDGEEAWDRWNSRHWGRLIRPDGTDVVIGYDLYGSHAIGFVEDHGKHNKQNLDEGGRSKAVTVAKDNYRLDTALLLMPFLMLEPGTKLAYVGQVKDDAGSDNYDEIKVTFADPLRSELEFHVVVDRTSNLIQRIEIVKVGATQKVGFTMKDWTTAGGLKIAAARGNMGYSGETITIKDISVSDPDDTLFIAPVGN